MVEKKLSSDNAETVVVSFAQFFLSGLNSFAHLDTHFDQLVIFCDFQVRFEYSSG
jgi:hypothetical protein